MIVIRNNLNAKIAVCVQARSMASEDECGEIAPASPVHVPSRRLNRMHKLSFMCFGALLVGLAP